MAAGHQYDMYQLGGAGRSGLGSPDERIGDVPMPDLTKKERRGELSHRAAQLLGGWGMSGRGAEPSAANAEPSNNTATAAGQIDTVHAEGGQATPASPLTSETVTATGLDQANVQASAQPPNQTTTG